MAADPSCLGLTSIFFGPEVDGRTEEGRSARERYCKSICFRCDFRNECLKQSIDTDQAWGVWGVWGGMGEGERRRFRKFLERSGYTKGTSEDDFRTLVKEFYQGEASKSKQRRSG